MSDMIERVARALANFNMPSVEWDNLFPEERQFYEQSAVAAIREMDFTDFCRAVMAGNRPKTGEPYDTIYAYLRRGSAAAGLLNEARAMLMAQAADLSMGSPVMDLCDRIENAIGPAKVSDVMSQLLPPPTGSKTDD